jgi:hypothetical protein
VNIRIATTPALLGALLAALAVLASGCGGDDGGTTLTVADESGGMTMGGGQSMPSMQMRELFSTKWQGMRIAAAFMQPPVAFSVWNGTRQVVVKPKPTDNLHFMIVLSDSETGERVPYASVQATITDDRGRLVYSSRQWPMLSRSMGMHYGNDLSLPRPGSYHLKLVVGPPAVGRHPEYQNVWLAPHVVDESFDWSGSL